MSYAVECYLDDAASETINALRTLFKKNKITIDEGTSPHISLAIYDEIDPELFSERIKDFSEVFSSFSFNFMNFGIFPTMESVLFMAPKVSDELLFFHSEFHKQFKPFSRNLSEYYSPEYWVPHCTIGIYLNKKQIRKAIGLLREIELPMKAEIREIGVNQFPPNRELFRYKLNKPTEK